MYIRVGLTNWLGDIEHILIESNSVICFGGADLQSATEKRLAGETLHATVLQHLRYVLVDEVRQGRVYIPKVA